MNVFPLLTPARSPERTASRRPGLVRLVGQIALCASLALGASVAHAVDVNVATATELETVRGIGPKTAENIIREREKGGPFKSFDDFSGRIRGIGAKRAQKLIDGGLTVGPAAASPKSQPGKRP